MTTPHKWAAEIHAMAEGKKVKGRPDESCEWRMADKSFNPFSRPDNEWRIVKPEKKVLRYRVAKMGIPNGDFWLEAVFINFAAEQKQKSLHFIEWLHDWQEVEVE